MIKKIKNKNAENFANKKTFDLITIIILITILSSTVFAQSIISQNKAMTITYDGTSIQKDKTVELQINQTSELLQNNLLNDYELLIKTRNKIFKYSGALSAPITYPIQEEGIHRISLIQKSSNTEVDNILFETNKEITTDKTQENNQQNNNNLLNKSNEINYKINTDKQTYSIGETVIANVKINKDFANAKLYLEYQDISQRYLGDLNFIVFIPQETGTYQFVLKDSNETIITKTSFEVIGSNNNQVLSNTLQDNQNDLQNTINKIKEQKYKEINFENKTDEEKNLSRKVKIRNSKNEYENSNLKIIEKKKIREFDKKKNNESNISENKDDNEYDLSIKFEDKTFESLEIKGLIIDPNTDTNDVNIGIEQVPKEKLKLDDNVVKKAFSIDPTNINFTSASLKTKAVGRELWKCKNWLFDEQICQGSWEKIADIIPGISYDINITADDPGFIETGLSTINTNKSIYKINETVKIIGAVLDTKGFLVDYANVSITIISPQNITTVFTTDSNTVLKIDKGIYQSEYFSTQEEGNYTIIINAIKQNSNEYVNSTMISIFAVQNNYAFDIIRNAPYSIDPWKGPFESELNIIPLEENITQYNVTEKIPSNLQIINATGAVIFTLDNDTYLSWNNLTNNNTLKYTVQAPLVTPSLIVLGKAVINYFSNGVAKVFEEIREWFVAVDPVVTSEQGILVYMDRNNDGQIKFRNWTGSSIQSEVDTGLNFADRGSWVKVKCVENSDKCLLLEKDNGNDVNFAIFNATDWTWSQATVLASSPNFDIDSKDVECEDVSTRCLLAYENNTALNSVFAYRIWNGTALSTERAANITGGENFEIDWISLYPQKGTNRIGIAIQNNGGGGTGNTPGIFAGIWNGTTFGNWRTLTTNGPSDGSSRTFYRHFDCAWENSDRFVCFYGVDGSNGIFADRWNLTNWSSIGAIINNTGEPREFASCGNYPGSTFNHSLVGLLYCDSANDLDGGIWNGTAFSKTASTDNPAQNTNAECGDSNKAQTQYVQNFQCAWENDGEKALFVWVTNGNSYLTSGSYTKSTGTYSNSNWTAGTQIVATGAGQLRSANIVPNPLNNKVFLTYTDSARDGGCSLWTGTTWDGSGCDNSSVFETNGALAARVWLSFDWFRIPLPQPIITILEPNGTINIKDYSGITFPSSTSAAYNGNSTTLPPNAANSPASGSEFSSTSYVNTSTSDNKRSSSVVQVSGGIRAYQSYNFSVPESTVSLTTLTITHEGYATTGVSQSADTFYMYIYNWSSDSYVLIKTIFPSAVDVISQEVIDYGINDFVRNRNLYILLEASTATSAGAGARSEMLTDYISVQVDNLPLIGNTIRVNASAIDDDGVSYCEWKLINNTNTSITSFKRMPSTGSNLFFNISSTTNVTDGFYNVSVYCNDTLNNRQNATKKIFIDNTLPNIRLYDLTNGINLTRNYGEFYWNVTDIPFENLACNITIDGIVKAANVLSVHGENTTKNITSLSDGTHYWNITCIDDAGNQNTSATRVFDIDTAGPVITLNNPAANSYVKSSYVDFNFTPVDAHDILNCTLRLDNTVNTTIYNVSNGTISNISQSGLTQGTHRWNITCIDSFGFRTNSSNRNFTYDTIIPYIVLNTSNGVIFNGTVPQLNYTASDNIDISLTCNITVNDVIVDANIASPNNSLVIRNISLIDGFKSWNVTCVDDAGNSNTSENRIFQVISGPLVTLKTPANRTVNNGINVNFTYNASDGNGIANCSFYFDGVINQSNTTIVNNGINNFILANISQGVHNWRVDCYDTTETLGTSATWIIVSDKSIPFISLNTPSAGQIINFTPTKMNFTMIDTYSPNATCNITVDSSVVSSGIIAYNNTMVNRNITLLNGIHFWNVTCVDLGGNSNTSITRNFTVNVTIPISVNVTVNKKTYQEGELAIVNVTTRNDTNGLTSTNITLDYIYTNRTFTDLAWWNTSWQKRKPIFINESIGLTRTEQPVYLNLTFNYGTITSCQNELRIISDLNGSEAPYKVLSGDDVTYCNILFTASASANAVNENNYHIYFNNSNPPANNYADVESITLWSDDFEDLNLVGWTVGAGWDTSTGNPLTGNHAHIQGSVTDITLSPNITFNLSLYSLVSLTFTWEINTNFDAGEYMRLDFTNNSETSWVQNASLDGNVNEGTAFTYSVNLSNSLKTDGFNFRYRTTTSATNEDAGIDDVILAASLTRATNITTWAGDDQEIIKREINRTNSTGKYISNITTVGRTYGNYSTVATAKANSITTRDGTGYEWFVLIPDTVGPVITLLYPANGSTFRSGNITFNYTANDFANDVANCTLFINNVFNQTNTTINETATNRFIINFMPEARYNWSISCFDTLGSRSYSANYTFDLDDTPPVVTPISPNLTTLPIGLINFTFNTTDNLDNILVCNVSVDNGNRTSIVNANNAAITGVLINISLTGQHKWNVTCFDNINNTASSIFLNFTTADIPVVKLDSPINGYGVNSTSISLFYNLSSGNINNCTLILNGAGNQTQNSTEIPFTSNNGLNNFTITNANYGKYNWTIYCLDTNNFNTTDTLRVFYLDNDIPIINLTFPANNQTMYTRNIRFNFTVTDQVDELLTCNLTIDNVLNVSIINASNGTPTAQLVSGLSITNHSWFVSCIDNAGFSVYSSIYNFTIVSNTSVTLISPANNSFDGTGNISFKYIPQSTAGFSLGFCELYLDGVSVQTQVAPTEDVQNTFTKNNIIQGNHTWYVNCTDNSAISTTSNTWKFTVDLSNPTVTAVSPNATLFTSNIINFNWTAYDDLALNLTCYVRVNSTLQTPSVVMANNSYINRTYSGFADGLFNWNVTCSDDGGRNGTSNNLNFTVQEPPKIKLNTPTNNSRTRNQSIKFFFTPTDNSGLIANCTLILDGARNETNTTSSASGAQRNITANNITEGVHNWTVNCTDFSNNEGTNLTEFVFTIDRTPPIITQTFPLEGNFLNGNDVTFNWTATDYTGVTISCSLYVDGIFNRTVSSASPASFSQVVLNRTEGPHNWSLNCSDDLGNSNISGVINFTINQPDLFINNTRLTINNTNPRILESIRISANVTNIGGINIPNAFVEFWDGEPGTGIYIGNATGSVNVSQNRILFVEWNITAGFHQIWAIVDPNNVYSELDETNNNATLNISTLWVNITDPVNNTLTTNTNNSYNFTAYDYTGQTLNYTVFVNGVNSGYNGTVTDGILNTINLNLSEGIKRIRVEALDYLGRKKNSTELTITIDFTAPIGTINTLNQTWFNRSDPPINFTATDNTDPLIEYFIYVNLTLNVSGNISNGTTITRQISNYSDGAYLILLQTRDDAGNTRNNTLKTIFIDTANPSVILNTPLDGANFSTRNITLNFTATDNLAPNLTCNVTIDSIIVGGAVATNGAFRLFNATNLNEGTHSWNVTCIDLAGNRDTSSTQTFNIYNAPIITLNTPINATWTNTENVTFFFNVSDETGINNCSLILNGIVANTKPGSQITNNAQNNITGIGLNGTYIWSIQCLDNTTIPQLGISQNRTIYVDLDNPIPLILTLNETWYNTSSPRITINVTDNMDTILNISVYVDGVLNVNATANNGTATQVTLTSLINGSHSVFIQAFDEAGNNANSSTIIIYVDTVRPFISLSAPTNGQPFNTTTITFNFTATDNLASYLICNLTISNGFAQTNINVTNNTNQNFTFSGFVSGTYNWNVTCIDFAGNKNTSTTFNFTINSPDLVITTSNITFNQSVFEEASQIMIYANIFNVGGVAANNITVQFWRGTPFTTGTQINSNFTIPTLSAGENITVNMTYSPIIGINNIYVEIDPVSTLNGSIQEENETNNRANKTLSVPQYHIYSGNLTGIIQIEKQSINLSLFGWEVENNSGSHIFVSDIESNLNFYRLQAIGSNITNGTTTNDFNDIDLKLGTQNLTDSINRTYTTNNNPINTINLSIYSKKINNIPIVNSSNDTTSFKTGILWDTSDGGVEYNGTQDLAFISETAKAAQGSKGIYDFEIEVPAYMRNYNAAGTTIAFYIELK